LVGLKRARAPKEEKTRKEKRRWNKGRGLKRDKNRFKQFSKIDFVSKQFSKFANILVSYF
jgi:hypothetical protein